MIEDSELLRQFLLKDDEPAFAELVRRHLNHVYSTAFRLVGGDQHLAEDVTQTVFADLARKAGKLQNYRALSGWLHTSTRFAAAKVVRSEQRRHVREQEILSMEHPLQEPNLQWSQIRPILDESLGELDEVDKQALLLRYFEAKGFGDIGGVLGLSESGARMRVERALDKLRARLAVRGITSTAVVLGTALAQNVVMPAPSTLSVRIISDALKAGPKKTAEKVATTASKLSVGAFVVIMAGFLTLFIWVAIHPHAPTITRGLEGIIDPAREPQNSQQEAPAKARVRSAPGVELTFLDDATGLPVTNKTVFLKGWRPWITHMVEREVELQDARCIAPFQPVSGRDYEILVHIETYADVRLRWQLDESAPTPESQLVRLVRPADIGGKVVDPFGEPVSGATLGFNTKEIPRAGRFSEDHCVDYLEPITDTNGQWSLARLAPEMIGKLVGSASHPDYSDSPMVTVSNQTDVVEALLKHTFILQLGAGLVLRGTIVDLQHKPISGAHVRVGTFKTSATKESTTDSDGNFIIKGCAPSGILTAEAEGFAPSWSLVSPESNPGPVVLMLGQGKALRLRVSNKNGDPVAGVTLLLQSRPHSENDPVPQIEMKRTANDYGVIEWLNAPEQNLEFSLTARGYMDKYFNLTPDDTEHSIVMQQALTLSGTVRDAQTGEGIPKFRLGIGFPQFRTDGSYQAVWAPFDPYWVNFTEGTFRKILTDPVATLLPDAGYIFRFEADGYAPFITRRYTAEEGTVELDVQLAPVPEVFAIAYLADGRPAANVEVGLIMAGTDAILVPGGFNDASGSAVTCVRRTDSTGHFRVPRGRVERVVLASPDGYAELELVQLETQKSVRLRPWARLSGKFQQNRNPTIARRILLKPLFNGLETPLPLDEEAFETTTREDGSFAFSKVPPIPLRIFQHLGDGRLIPVGDVSPKPGEEVLVTSE